MTRVQLMILMFACLLCSSGCLCCRGTWAAADVVDDISDHQLCLDDCYDPRFDISRARMPDWNCCKFNRRLCQHGWSCKCQQAQQVWYPAEYRTAYNNRMNAAQNKPAVPSPAPAYE